MFSRALLKCFQNPFLQFGWFHFPQRRDNNLPLVKSCMNHSNCALPLCANPSAASIFAFPRTHLRSASPRSHKEAAAADLHPSPWPISIISSRAAARRVSLSKITRTIHIPPAASTTAIFWGKLGNSAGEY
jgi:hypothetical protein